MRRFSLGGSGVSSSRRTLVRFRFGSLSTKIVICGQCLPTLPFMINETLKWLSSLPILMQESLWWWWCIVRYSLSLASLSLAPPQGVSVPSSTTSEATRSWTNLTNQINNKVVLDYQQRGTFCVRSRTPSMCNYQSVYLPWIFKNTLHKASHSCRITCERSESARDRRIALYKRNHHHHHHHHHHHPHSCI